MDLLVAAFAISSNCLQWRQTNNLTLIFDTAINNQHSSFVNTSGNSSSWTIFENIGRKQDKNEFSPVMLSSNAIDNREVSISTSWTSVICSCKNDFWDYLCRCHVIVINFVFRTFFVTVCINGQEPPRLFSKTSNLEREENSCAWKNNFEWSGMQSWNFTNFDGKLLTFEFSSTTDPTKSK